jgi:uncharacterized repeat protein (TIGR01451 family)
LIAVDATGTPLEALPTVLDLGVTYAEASANSTGPLRGDPALRSDAYAANLDPLEALEALDLTDLLSSVGQSAPPDNAAPATANLLAIPAQPLATVSVSDASALAHWAGDNACVSSTTPLAQGANRTAQVDLLNAPGVGSVVSIEPTQEGASSVQSTLSLPSIEGPGDSRAVVAESETQIAGVSLLGGALDIQVVGDPTLTATATGLEGGASVVYDAPIVIINGETVLDAITLGEDILGPILDALGPVLDALSDLISVEVTIPDADIEVAPNGTIALGSAAVARVQISLLPVLGGEGIVLADLAIAPMEVAAFAPLGGLICPPVVDAEKDAPGLVSPGEEFDYTITITNNACAVGLTNITISDTITAPAGTEIVSTTPEGTVDGLTVTWTDPGPQALGVSKEYKIRVKLPADIPIGTRLANDVSVGADCDTDRHEDTDHIDRPEIGGILSRTGGDQQNPLLLGVGAAALLGALVMRRTRRGATVL